MFGDTKSAQEIKKMSSKITRIVRKLRAHRLISKIPRSTRYKVTEKGSRILGGISYDEKEIPPGKYEKSCLKNLQKKEVFTE